MKTLMTSHQASFCSLLYFHCISDELNSSFLRIPTVLQVQL
uniref:Uncharacterized protein n=1 Tax=Anguilla anguilla TaxID=7936 RepID=A0A0E9T5U9_ANGAN